ncbi:MAG: hypothetical protein SH847_26800 [Roseiflexaceae bacterium]|nr:hypothetical protein [Roseiflexaceae bacterium]
MAVTMQQNATLIDTLSEGYRTINRRPLLVLVPILLNLYLWFGTQISFAPLLGDLLGFMQRMQPASAPADSTDPASLEKVFQFIGLIDMRQPLAVLNFIPTLPITQMVGLTGAVAKAIEIRTVGGVALAFMLINLVALPLSAAFLTRMAQMIRNEVATSELTLRQSARSGLFILGTLAVIVGVGAALVLPFAIFSFILMGLNQEIGAFAFTLLALAIFWVQIYLGFANEAVVIGGLRPLRAIHASFNIVRHNFWSTLGLLGLSYIISAGGAEIWRALIGSTAGLAFAIIGSAYVGCGLQAARMIFFQDRLQRWQTQPKRP